MMDIRRLYLLQKLSESLTDEERQILAGQDRERNNEKIMAELQEIKRKQSFGIDFAANVAGSAAVDVFWTIARRLLKKIH